MMINKNNKKMLISVLVIIIIFVLICLLINIFRGDISYKIDNKDGIKFANEYEKLNSQEVEDGKKYPKVEISSDNIIKYSTVEEVLDIFDNMEDAVIYFGYSTCLYCRNAIQVLIDTAKDTELDVIHYIDIEEIWDVKELNENNEIVTVKEANSKYYELLNILGDELVVDYVLNDSNGNDVKTGDKRLYVPLVIFVTDGKVVSYNKGTLFSQEDPFVELDKYQREGLSEIYRYGIRDVVDSKKRKGLLN